MRRALAPLDPPPAPQVALEERLRVTAARLAGLPDDQVASLSITTGWQGHDEAGVRDLARTAAARAGLAMSVRGDGDVVTVHFSRSRGAQDRAD